MATQPKPNGELVEVFDTMEESEALVVKGLLESAGLPALITALDAPQDVLPGVGGVVVRVPEDRAEEARRLIEEYRSAGQTTDEEAASAPE
jgi:hypothetical protein